MTSKEKELKKDEMRTEKGQVEKPFEPKRTDLYWTMFLCRIEFELDFL